MPLLPVPGRPDLVLHTGTPASGVGRLAARPGSTSPYWAYPWSGGLALARYLADHPEAVAGRRVLDLGAGGGLVGIAGARAGAARVEAAEIDPLARVALQLNAAANGVSVALLEGDIIAGEPPGVDIVCVGDLFYEAGLARRVTSWLERCRAAGIDVLVGDPGRAALPLDRLTPLATYDLGSNGFGERQATAYAFAAQPPLR